MPGRCQIGARKIDMHLVGLQALGVEFEVDHGVLIARTPNEAYGKPCDARVPERRTTEENLLMAAVVAEGRHLPGERRLRA